MRNNFDFILNTYFSDFVKIIMVNNNTGEFQFLRRLPEEETPESLDIRTIDEYAERIVAKQMRTQNAAEDIVFHSKSQYMKQLAESGEYKSVHTDIYHIGDRYLWLTCRISIPKDFSEENPWYLITWKPTDSETEAMAELMVIFSTCFYKVLKVNLTVDTFEIVKVIDDELNYDVVNTNRITEWWRLFAEQGCVYKDDISIYRRFTDIAYLRRQLKSGERFLRCHYRRKNGDVFRWVSMEIIPSLDYTDENQSVMLYIRDINDDYISDVMHQQELEDICYHDSATGLYNRLQYNRLCDKFADGCENSVGLIFADLNRLKYINDNYGHAQGDKYIKDFALMLAAQFGSEYSYRLSGDEFIVVLQNISREHFYALSEDFYRSVQQMEIPVAAVGSAYEGSGGKNLEAIERQAELNMYVDKKNFYERFSEYSRKKSTII